MGHSQLTQHWVEKNRHKRARRMAKQLGLKPEQVEGTMQTMIESKLKEIRKARRKGKKDDD